MANPEVGFTACVDKLLNLLALRLQRSCYVMIVHCDMLLNNQQCHIKFHIDKNRGSHSNVRVTFYDVNLFQDV